MNPPRAGAGTSWLAVHAEWTKLRTAPGTVWLLLAAAAATVAVGAAAATTTCPAANCGIDPAKVSLTGIQLGQAVVAVLAVLTIGAEYGTGMVQTTFTAMPRRAGVLAAKAAVLTAAVTVTGAVAALGSLLAGRFILPGRGAPPLSLVDGPVLRAGAGSVLYLALIALLSLGVGTATRNPATAIGVVLGLLYVLPVITEAVSDPDLQRHLQQFAPMTAGLAVVATTGLDRPPIGPWAGLGVLAGWAAAALVVGGLLLRLRDA